MFPEPSRQATAGVPGSAVRDDGGETADGQHMGTNARSLGVPRPQPVDDLDWPPDQATSLGHAAVDLWREFLEHLPDMPIHRGFQTQVVAAAMAWEVPDEPDDATALLADTRELMLEWSMYPGNGGFLGYVSGSGTVPGAPADLLAAALNNNAGGWRLSPGITELEQRLLGWFATQLGLPATSGGYLSQAVPPPTTTRSWWPEMPRRVGTSGVMASEAVLC